MHSYKNVRNAHVYVRTDIVSAPVEPEGLMCYQITAIIILITFYAFYFAKIVIQGKQNIKTNRMGVGNKSAKVLMIERITACATVLALVSGVCSILWVRQFPTTAVRVTGIILGILGVLCFALATTTMKSAWRVGIPEEKTMLITRGIYSISRNPAFVGFDLMFLSICFMFYNLPLMLCSSFAMVMLHLQILQEEEHMHRMFGEEYEAYRKHTYRYWGRR